MTTPNRDGPRSVAGDAGSGPPHDWPRSFSRRQFLVVGAATVGSLVAAGCSRSGVRLVEASSRDVVEAERRRRRPDAAVRDVQLTAAPTTVDLAGLTAATWAYNGSVPGPEIRVGAGDVLRATFTNLLDEPTTIHWHGIALRNDMDGVPGVTQPDVEPGGKFTYEFTAPDPGTFWFHPHSGLQLDRGLYAPLVVEDPDEPGRYDREWTVVLDDWADGIGQPAEATLADLRAGRGAHAAHTGGGGPRSELLSGPGGDVSYPLFLLNARAPKDPVVFDAMPGERIRIRILNAASDTAFRVALGGHRLTVTHTDGFPVDPVEGDAVLVAMSERYDVLVTVAGPGVFPLVARAEGKGNQALGVIRAASDADVPPADVRPDALAGRVISAGDLVATAGAALPPGLPDRTHRVVLGGGTEGYRWTINGKSHDPESHRADDQLEVRQGEKVRVVFDNRTTMFHPMHLHGHTFQIDRRGAPGPRKDSLIVRPDERVVFDFVADNPGQWMLHCHNLYHQAGGMATMVSYVR